MACQYDGVWVSWNISINDTLMISVKGMLMVSIMGMLTSKRDTFGKKKDKKFWQKGKRKILRNKPLANCSTVSWARPTLCFLPPKE